MGSAVGVGVGVGVGVAVAVAVGVGVGVAVGVPVAVAVGVGVGVGVIKPNLAFLYRRNLAITKVRVPYSYVLYATLGKCRSSVI